MISALTMRSSYADGFNPDRWSNNIKAHVVFGRTASGRIYLRGDFIGLYHMHLYSHPNHLPLTKKEVFGGDNGGTGIWAKKIKELRSHYQLHAERGCSNRIS